jgi:hypothetical protein
MSFTLWEYTPEIKSRQWVKHMEPVINPWDRCSNSVVNSGLIAGECVREPPGIQLNRLEVGPPSDAPFPLFSSRLLSALLISTSLLSASVLVTPCLSSRSSQPALTTC